MRKRKLIITAVTMLIIAGQLIGCGSKEEKGDAKKTAETTEFNSEEINSKVLSAMKSLMDIDMRAMIAEAKVEKMRDIAKTTYQSISDQLTVDENTYVSEFIQLIDQGKEQAEIEQTLLEKYKSETAGEKMRETAKSTYQSISNQLTVDENTYVSEYILLIDQGKAQSEVEQTLLTKYKKEEESSKRQEQENQGLAEQYTTNPLANGVKMEGIVGYVEVCGTKLYVAENQYVYREDKTTLVTQDEFEEIISGSNEFTVRPITEQPTNPTPPEPEVPEPTTLSPEQQSEKDHWQELINQGSEVMSGGVQIPSSGANWE